LNALCTGPGFFGSSSAQARCILLPSRTSAYTPSPAGRAAGSTRSPRVSVSYVSRRRTSSNSWPEIRDHLDEAPVALVPLDVGQTLAADVNQAEATALRLEHEAEVLDVVDVLGRGVPVPLLGLLCGAHLRPVQEIDIALLQNLRCRSGLGLLRHFPARLRPCAGTTGRK
jgi:hypothetical protein